MAGYTELARSLAEEIAAGGIGEGDRLPALRPLASTRGASQATALRAYRELAAAGVITTEERRIGKVAPGGALAAARYLRGGGTFRLAGSDDPALLLLVQEAPAEVDLASTDGSAAGLAALQQGDADGAVLHLWHAGGAYNAPYAQAVVDDARLVRLWSREAGLAVAPQNPRRVRRAADLAGLRVARRPVGTGARSLLDRVTGDAGIVLDASDPEVPRNLDVALAVASGSADAGVTSRAVAERFGLGFVPLQWEPVDVAVGGAAVSGLQPLLKALRRAEVRRRIEALGGYDLAEAGRAERC
jgi:molybdate-binding protein